MLHYRLRAGWSRRVQCEDVELLLKICLRCWVGGEEEEEQETSEEKRQSKEWLGEQKSWVWLYLSLELRAGGGFSFPHQLSGMWYWGDAGWHQQVMSQLADSLLRAWVQDLTKRVLSSAGEGQALSYVLCVPAPSQRCKDVLQPDGPITPLFIEENWIFRVVWGQKWKDCLALVHWVIALSEPGLRVPMELVVFFLPTEWSLLVAVWLSDGLLTVNDCHNLKKKKLFTNFLSCGAENNSKINLSYITRRKQIDYPRWPN